jgi:hypothetical protein
MYYDLAPEYGFEKYWLNPDTEMQAAGIQTWQNSTNPFAMSTFFQRNIFDDNFIATEKFFTYSKEHQSQLKKLMFLYGSHNLEKLYTNDTWKRRKIEALGQLSYFIYHHISHNMETNVVNWWMNRKSKSAEESSRWARLGLRDRAAKNELQDKSVGFEIDVNTGVRKVGHGRLMEDDRVGTVRIETPSHYKPRNTQ